MRSHQLRHSSGGRRRPARARARGQNSAWNKAAVDALAEDYGMAGQPTEATRPRRYRREPGRTTERSTPRSPLRTRWTRISGGERSRSTRTATSISARALSRPSCSSRKPRPFMVPFVVLGELRAGFALGRRHAENERTLRRLLLKDGVRVLFADDQTTHHYASVFRQLRKQGTPIPDQRHVAGGARPAAQSRSARPRQALQSSPADCPRVNRDAERAHPKLSPSSM